MVRRYDAKSEEAMRNIKMPVVKDVRNPDSYYMGKQDWDGSMGYLSEMDGRAARDSAKLRKNREK